MSAWQLLRDAPRRLEAQLPRPHLRSLPSPVRQLSRVPFVGLVVALLVAGLVGLMVLNAAMTDRAFVLSGQQRKAAVLASQLSDLESQVTRANSPAQLAGRASDLGMVPNPYGVFIDLSSGRVIGEPIAPTGREIPSLRVRPTVTDANGVVQPVETRVLPWVDLSRLTPPKDAEQDATAQEGRG